VIPDLTIAPAELSLFADAPSWMRPSGVAMVAEVTKTVTLFSGPSRDAYVNTATVPFGDPLDLPEPFSFTLETAAFVA
jgi:hypothetical protein